jgi:signal transduction histidine kinase
VRLLAAVQQRSAIAGNSLYLLADAGGRPLAGNLYGAPAQVTSEAGWHEFAYRRIEGGESSERLALARSYILDEGYRLVIGRDIEERRSFERVVASALVWGLGLTIALGIVGGLAASRRLLARLDAMAVTSEAIMAGDLSERIPETGTGDELDRLAVSLNAMLDRIERLMGGLKDVSDNIAHDLKTPLTRLRTRAESALRREGEPEAYRNALEQTIEEADQLIRIFNALLSIAAAEAGAARTSFDELDAATLARDVAELYEPIAEDSNATLTVRADGPAPLYGDRELISQALANLIDNALKYGLPEKAEEEGAGTPRGEIALAVARRGSAVEISVCDHGPGVPESERERVLQRFVRLETSRSRPGSGLGLSLAAAVARLHKGELKLEDNAPGLAVRMVLPSHRS